MGVSTHHIGASAIGVVEVQLPKRIERPGVSSVTMPRKIGFLQHIVPAAVVLNRTRVSVGQKNGSWLTQAKGSLPDN